MTDEELVAEYLKDDSKYLIEDAEANLYRPRQPRHWSRLYPCEKTRHKPRMVSKDKGNYRRRK